jgi:Response regulator receiver domain.
MDAIMHNRQTKVKIAISDDSPFITDSIRHILSKDLADMSVEVYPSQNQALLDKLQSEPVDLLITDFNLTFDNSLGGIKKIQSICRKAVGPK